MQKQKEIRNKATSMVKEHGQFAAIAADRQTIRMSNEDNKDGFYYWNAVRFAIIDYLCA
ncbi:hypothetical protein [Aestuariispira insulae]|uniref:Uncharacterized protein n=1 Tax=Aestuariispira insulae TaxID=1461337 RepID=A0A3D9HNJ4_9PROT|nr:hypothetical protein [Aestuariispira insulae]RED51064.1 hypothetical protein DFP90_104342 [Aestuariispira insulae]